MLLRALRPITTAAPVLRPRVAYRYGYATSTGRPSSHDAKQPGGGGSTSSSSSSNEKKDSSALPAPGQGTKIDVSGQGSSVKLDGLGPLVVNVDGSVGRVSNWQEMTVDERETTLRILGKRNKQRLGALKAAREESGRGQGSGGEF